MKIKNIKYEKVGDISSMYAYLEVYFIDENKPFMEIGVSDDKELIFKIYPAEKPLELTLEQWTHILKTANEHILEVIKDEEDLENFIKET